MKRIVEIDGCKECPHNGGTVPYPPQIGGTAIWCRKLHIKGTGYYRLAVNENFLKDCPLPKNDIEIVIN